MAATSLAERIKKYRIEKFGQPDDPEWLEKDCAAIAKAIIEEIQSNAIVTTTGVQTGGGTAPGTVTFTGS